MKHKSVLRGFMFLVIVTAIPCANTRADTAIAGGDSEINNRDGENKYRDLIKKLEIEHGPFDPALSESLLGLAHTLKNQGEYNVAVDVFKRAMHIQRVNDGLYNINQITILKDIIECNAALHDWDEVDEEYHYLLWVFDNAYPDPDPARLDAIDEVTAWHLAAFNLPTAALPARHLIMVRDLNETALELAEQLYGESGRELVPRLYKLALAEYYIAVGIQRGGLNGKALTDSMLIMNRNPSYYTTSQELVRKIYRKGITLLEHIISIYSDSSDTEPQASAMAMVYLADWHMLFNKHVTAFRLYRKAYNKLLDSGVNEASVGKYFETPVMLPIEKFSVRPDTASLPEFIPVKLLEATDRDDAGNIRNINTRPFVSWSDALPGLDYPAHAKHDMVQKPQAGAAYASFNVSKKGWAKNIRILDYQSHNIVTSKQAYDTLWSIQFRPRLVKGKAVSAKHYLLHYIPPE